MKCKVCGRELKGKGNICSNCYNKKQKEKAISKDKNLVYEIQAQFKPKYELLKMADYIVISIILILATLLYGNILLDIVIIAAVIACFAAWLIYRKNKLSKTFLRFYDTKVVLNIKDKEKVMLYKDLNDLGYYQTWKQKISKMGDIRLMPENSIVIMQGINMPDVGNIAEEFENVKDIIREKVSVEVKE